MFDYAFIPLQEHRYTLAATGVKFHDKVFASRQEANTYMYKTLRRRGLSVRKVWHDHHDVTYVCDNNVSFYIQRV